MVSGAPALGSVDQMRILRRAVPGLPVHSTRNNVALKRGWTMFRRNWLEYDIVALVMLVIGLGVVDLLALSF